MKEKGTGSAQLMTLLFTGVLMGALDISIVGPAIPAIEKTMVIPGKDLTWIYSIYILFNLIGISLLARLSDLFGRRLIYIFSVGVFGIGSLVVAMAGDINLLLAGRAIQGFGSSGIFPVALAVIGDTFPPEKRGRALGLIGAVFGLAFVMGPFIAGIMLQFYSWNMLFLVNIPVAVLIMIFSWFILPSTTDSGPRYPDWSGIILLALILGAFTLGINLVDSDNVSGTLFAWPVLPLLFFAAVLTPILIMVEASQKEPILQIELFRSRQVRIVGIVAVALGLFQSVTVFLPSFAVGLYRVLPSDASFMLLPVVAATALGSPLGGRLMDRFGSRLIILAGLIFISLSFAGYSLLPEHRMGFYLPGIVLGFGLAMRPALNYIMLNEVPQKERAATQGILLIFISLGQISGAAMLGVFTSSSSGLLNGYRWTFVSLAVLAAIILVFSLFLKSKKEEKI